MQASTSIRLKNEIHFLIIQKIFYGKQLKCPKLCEQKEKEQGKKLTRLAVESTETSWANTLVTVGATDLALATVHAWVVGASVCEDLTVVSGVSGQA